MSKITDAMLMAYADGELPASEAVSVEAAIEQDPKLQSKLARHQALNAVFDDGFSEIDNQPLPSGLMASIENSEQAETQVVPSIMSRLGEFFGGLDGWRPTLVAASLLLFAMVAFFPSANNGDQIPQQLVAMLDRLPDGSAANGTRIDASYVGKNEQFCRAFSDRPFLNKKGLACREKTGTWTLVASDALPPEGSFMPAGEDAVKSAISRMGLARLDDEAAYLRDN